MNSEVTFSRFNNGSENMRNESAMGSLGASILHRTSLRLASDFLSLKKKYFYLNFYDLLAKIK